MKKIFWKAFRNTEDIFFRVRDIYIFEICKLDDKIRN